MMEDFVSLSLETYDKMLGDKQLLNDKIFALSKTNVDKDREIEKLQRQLKVKEADRSSLAKSLDDYKKSNECKLSEKTAKKEGHGFDLVGLNVLVNNKDEGVVLGYNPYLTGGECSYLVAFVDGGALSWYERGDITVIFYC